MATSLVLPCYNPPPGWEQQVCANYEAFCNQVGERVELVIVLDGESKMVTNNSAKILSGNIPGIRMVAYRVNMGKGYAIRQGVAEATGDVVMYTDVDFPYTLSSMQLVYNVLNRGEYDVAIGVKNDAYYAQVPFLRRAISKFLRFMVRVFLSMPVTDTQCGLKGFSRNVAPLFLKTTINRYLFDLEFVRNCFKSKSCRVGAIPVTLKDNVQFRSMNYRILIPEMANFIKLLFNKS